jgi:NAD(P)-dependent dehydrogenase (short-subunit alcohol dehydrogenase family)
MTRTVIITGSAGHLGRALHAAFEGLGDRVVGVDMPSTGAEFGIDLDSPEGMQFASILKPVDIVICNAKCRTWEAHSALAAIATSCIINIGSIYGVLGNDPKTYDGTEIEPTPAAYAASKGALIALTKWQATNLAPARSNCVCPGGIYRGHSDLFRRRYEARVPLGRMASEKDIVGPVVFLASDAARYITGQVLMVDGGYSSW